LLYFFISAQRVGAASVPDADYQWFINGRVVKGAANKVLNIESVRAGDAGRYRVEIKNMAGTVTSREAELMVK
jgi:hypothetical protein